VFTTKNDKSLIGTILKLAIPIVSPNENAFDGSPVKTLKTSPDGVTSPGTTPPRTSHSLPVILKENELC